MSMHVWKEVSGLDVDIIAPVPKDWTLLLIISFVLCISYGYQLILKC